MYLGLERINGTWRWFDERTYPSEAGYGVWSEGEPNSDEDCAVMSDGWDGLYDMPCSDTCRRVCMMQ